MKELAQTLLPDLPNSLTWVYGIFYIIETIAFFSLLIMPLWLIVSPMKRKK